MKNRTMSGQKYGSAQYWNCDEWNEKLFHNCPSGKNVVLFVSSLRSHKYQIFKNIMLGSDFVFK